jgi:hypothetical protein
LLLTATFQRCLWMVSYVDIQNVPFMRSPRAAALLHRRSPSAETLCDWSSAEGHHTRGYYRSLEGTILSRNISVWVLLWVAAVDLLWLLYATRNYSGSIVSWATCEGFGSGRGLNDVTFLCFSGKIKITTKLSVRSFTMPIENRTQELPDASRSSCRLSQWDRFRVVNYPT